MFDRETDGQTDRQTDRRLSHGQSALADHFINKVYIGIESASSVTRIQCALGCVNTVSTRN